MAYNFKSEEDVKLYLQNIGIEYRYGCYSEKNANACHLLGEYLEVIKKEYAKAGRLFKDNCDERDYPRSCWRYASYVMLGKGGVEYDFLVGYKYLEKACRLNIPEACMNVGALSSQDHPEHNFKGNVQKAVEMLEKSCNLKLSNGCAEAFSYYAHGHRKSSASKTSTAPEDRVLPDMEKAFKFAIAGCELLDKQACAHVSTMYKRGEGVEKNAELATKYKNIALEMERDTNKTLKFQQGV